MGNNSSTPSGPVPAPSSVPSSSPRAKSTHIPFSFGTEIELILKAKEGKLADAQGVIKDLKSISADLDSLLPVLKSKKVNVNDWRDETATKVRALWCRLIVTLINGRNTSSIKCLYAQSDEAIEAKRQGTYYKNWTVIEDITLRPDLALEHMAVEVVTSVQFTNRSGWDTAFADVMGLIMNVFHIVPSSSASTHVHLKRLPPDDEAAAKADDAYLRRISIAQARNMAKFIIFWEPCLDLLTPLDSDAEAFCKTNLNGLWLQNDLGNFENSAFGELFARVDKLLDDEGWTMSQNLSKIFSEIEKTAEKTAAPLDHKLGRLSLYMTGLDKEFPDDYIPDRNVAWNFENVWLPTRGKTKPTGTIEYRRLTESRSVAELYANTAVALCFAQAAARSRGSTADRVYNMMVETPIKDQYDWKGFGRQKFMEFSAMMREAADELGILEFLPAALLKG